MGWFLVVYGVATFIVAVVIRVPNANAGVRSHVKDAGTLIELGLLTLSFPLRVHALVLSVVVIAGRLISRSRRRQSSRAGSVTEAGLDG